MRGWPWVRSEKFFSLGLGFNATRQKWQVLNEKFFAFGGPTMRKAQLLRRQAAPSSKNTKNKKLPESFSKRLQKCQEMLTDPYLPYRPVEVIGALNDLYDFSYFGGDKARQVSMVQAGHASLATGAEP